MKIKKNNQKKNNNNDDASKGFIMNAISKIYKQKEDYSHIQTHVPSNVVPSHAVLLKLVSEIDNSQHLDGGFKCLKYCNNLRFYQNNKDPKTILVGVRDTDFTCLDDVFNIIVRTAMFRGSVTKLKRYKECLEDIAEFQTKYPVDKYHFVGFGASIAGAICDEFLDLGYLHEALTYNSVVQPRFMNRSDLKHYRIYVRGDICYLSSGQYAPNAKVYALPINKKTFINPIEEINYLYHIHTLCNKKSRSLPHLIKILTKEEKNRGGD